LHPQENKKLYKRHKKIRRKNKIFHEVNRNCIKKDNCQPIRTKSIDENHASTNRVKGGERKKKLEEQFQYNGFTSID
jgi:hypothetical protein